MKKFFILSFIIILIISVTLLAKHNRKNPENKNNDDIEKLLVVDSINDEKELDKQFTLVKETDNTSNTKVNEREPIDYISKLKDKDNSKDNSKDNNEDTDIKKVENNASQNEINVYTAVNVREEDHKILSRLIESEAGAEPYLGKLAVASVVLNRMKEDNEGLEEVIYKKGQFDGVKTTNFNIEPSEDSKKAAIEVLRGHNVVPTAYFFADLKILKCDMYSDNKPDFARIDKFIVRIGDHWFFKK